MQQEILQVDLKNEAMERPKLKLNLFFTDTFSDRTP